MFSAMLNRRAPPFDSRGMTEQYDLIVVGCGPAGEAAATLASDFRKRVAVVDEHAAHEGHLAFFALREAALFASGFGRTPLPGAEGPFDRSQPLRDLLTPRLALKDAAHDKLKSSLDRPNIAVHRGLGRLADARTVVVEGADGTKQKLKADRILIATGAETDFPKHMPADHPRIVDPRSVLSLETLPASIVIVGSDAMSFAYASIFAGLEVETTLVSPDKETLAYIDVECRDHLALAMKHAGVRFRIGRTVTAVESKKGEVLRIDLDEGEPVDAGALLFNAARRGRTSSLNLKKFGVNLDADGHIEVDDDGRTSAESIFAAGDVTGDSGVTAMARLRARTAISTMFDMPLRRRSDHVVPTCLHTIPAVSFVGLGEWEAREQEIPVVTGRALLQFNPRGMTTGDGHGILKCVFNRETQKLIGTTIVGRDAAELIHLAQHVMIADGGIDDFVGMNFNQPTLSELYRYAGYAALQSLARLEERDDDLGGMAKVA